jgi:hypothetical protein
VMRTSRASEDEEIGRLHPVWRVLPSSDHDGRWAVNTSPQVTICRLSDGKSWTPAVTAAMEILPPGSCLVVSADRGLPRAFLGLLSHGRWKRESAPPLRKVSTLLERAGFEIRGEYAIWPSADKPRVVLRASDFRGFKWVQRSGVLGGGGRRVLLRAMARSPLATLIAYLLAPAGAVVARRPVPGEQPEWQTS